MLFVEGVVCEGGFGLGTTAMEVGRFVDKGVGFVGRVVEGGVVVVIGAGEGVVSVQHLVLNMYFLNIFQSRQNCLTQISRLIQAQNSA